MKCPTDHPLFPIHNHSGYSMLDGADSVTSYVDFASKNGMPLCAMTDHGYVSGCYELVEACAKAKIKPVEGIEFYLHPGDYSPPDGGKTPRYWHLTSWAATETGWTNMKHLTARSFVGDRVVSTFGSVKPRIVWEDLHSMNKGLIVGTGCMMGPVGGALVKGDRPAAERHFDWLLEIFGDRLFAEIMPSRVVCDYATRRTNGRELVVFTTEKGDDICVEQDDILDTNLGEMTAREALENQPWEVYGVIPRRWLPVDLDSEEERVICI